MYYVQDNNSAEQTIHSVQSSHNCCSLGNSRAKNAINLITVIAVVTLHCLRVILFNVLRRVIVIRLLRPCILTISHGASLGRDRRESSALWL